MSENKRNGRSANGRGYYIALILCAAAIGITGYLYTRSANQAQEVVLPETESEEIFLDISDEEDVPVLATQSGASVPESTEAVPPATRKKTMKTMSPVAGASIYGYSMEALSYNQTTRDWRVHNGIDLAAADGAEVVSAADGEVYTVYEDDAMGHTVVIRHDDGYTTRYASLMQNAAVKAGDRVTMGQVIGYAGDSAIVESAMGSHVHFSVTFYDEPMDPAEFLALGS